MPINRPFFLTAQDMLFDSSCQKLMFGFFRNNFLSIFRDTAKIYACQITVVT